MEDQVAIKVDNVSKDFVLPHEKIGTVKGLFTGLNKIGAKQGKETQHALKDISFEIKEGEFFGIVGRNGSGKSTLLKLLANIYQPTKGKVYTKGKLVPFIELGVGFNPELTGKENVYLNGAMLGFSEKETSEMYKDIVEFAELERFMDQKLKNYSSGMQVRLAFSMAIRAEADILLIDEVLAVGDADFQRKCFDYFKQLKKDKKTVVFVSHDMSAVKEFCDRAALIEKSELAFIGSANDVADRYSILFINDVSTEKNLNKLALEKRSGNGEVKIKSAKVSKPVITENDPNLSLHLVAECHGTPSQLAIGFAIKNAEGLIINGSHTWEHKLVLPEIRPGEKIETIWDINNIYEDGLHTVDVYAYGSNHVIYDRIDDAITFRSKRTYRSGCLIWLPTQVKVNKLTNE